MIPFPNGPLPAPAQGESSVDFAKRLVAASGAAGMANWVARVHAAAGISPPF